MTPLLRVQAGVGDYLAMVTGAVAAAGIVRRVRNLDRAMGRTFRSRRVGNFQATRTPWGRKVWQRADIDEIMTMKRPASLPARQFPGKTNAFAAKKGYAPARINPHTGRVEKLVLHHQGGRAGGSLVETWASTHSRLPHGLANSARPWRDVHPDWASSFGGERFGYWRWRAGGYRNPPSRLPGPQPPLE